MDAIAAAVQGLTIAQIKVKNGGIKVKSWVTYQDEKGSGGVFMTHSEPYNTKANLSALMEYLSTNYLDGRACIVTGIMPLEDD